MSQGEHSAVLERVLEPASRTMTPEIARWFLSLRPEPEIEDLLEQLASKNTAGKLTDEERADYELLVLMGDFIAILQAKARALIGPSIQS